MYIYKGPAGLSVILVFTPNITAYMPDLGQARMVLLFIYNRKKVRGEHLTVETMNKIVVRVNSTFSHQTETTFVAQ
jgi:hypothetical protein